MTPAPTIRVDLGPRSYDILVGTGVLSQLGRFVSDRRRVSHAVIVTDENVAEPYAAQAADALAQSGATVDVLVVPAGETSKSVEMAEILWQKILALGTDRKSLIVALGGGVVGDLAGFIAATFARGLALVQVPTTLLAQVDSSVGGKVGINLPGAKNMVGAFWQPLGVLIDTAVLQSLPEREYRAGLAEVIKYGVILDAALFDYLEEHIEAINRRDPTVLQHVILRSCRLKADVVEADEREETGGRAVLNYGHTFAHAFEAVAGYGTLLHGEAVAIGMVCAARLASQLGKFPSAAIERQQKLITSLGLPTVVGPWDHAALVAAMQHDKKMEHGRLRFVLPDRIGHVELVEQVPETAVLAALNG